MSSENEFRLCDGRTVAYQLGGIESGWPVFMFHGALGVGDFSEHQNLFCELGMWCICPTLPGWGESTPKQDRKVSEWANDVQELANSLRIDRFDVVGISLGGPHALACTIALPERVRKTLILSGHAPFINNKGFNPFKGMDIPSRLGLSWFASKFSLLGKVAAAHIKKKTQESDSGISFVNDVLLSKLNPDECEQFQRLSESRRYSMPSTLARGMFRSLEHSVVGYVELPVLLRTWSSKDLETIRNGGEAVMIVGSHGDRIVPFSHAEFLSQLMPQSCLISLTGGHLTVVFCFGQLLQRFMEWKPGADAAPQRIHLDSLSLA